jgi:hypothetical protein
MVLAMEAMYDSGEDQERIDYTPGANVANGEVLEIGTDGLAGVITTPGGILSGVLGSIATAGNFKFKKAVSGGVTFDLGVPVFWDHSANTAIAAAGEAADFIVGTCIKAAVDADDHVVVTLNRLSSNRAVVDTT